MKDNGSGISLVLGFLAIVALLVFFAIPMISSSPATLASAAQDDGGTVKVKMFVLTQSSDLKNYAAFNKKLSAWLKKEKPEIISTDSNMMATGTGGWTIVKWIYYK